MTPEQAAIYVRQRVNLPSSEIPRIITMIDAALIRLAAMVSDNVLSRELLMTDPEQVTGLVVDGKINLLDLGDQPEVKEIFRDKLHFGKMYYTTLEGQVTVFHPIQWKHSVDFLDLDDARTEPYIRLEGDTLIVKNIPNGTEVHFSVPYVPFLDSLPARLEQDFVSQLASMVAPQ